MDVRWVTGSLDTPAAGAPAAEAFWQAVTGTAVSARRGPGGRFAALVPARGDACLRVQVVGSAAPGAHVDLHTGDVPAAAAAAVRLGAGVTHEQDGLVVLRSPAGIAFCLVRWAGEVARPAPVRWAGGQRGTVDQLCLDVPVASFEAEAAFWGALTGWVRRRTDLAEFDYLRRGPGMPLRLLLQRIGAGVAGVHLDFACDDVDTEVARQVGLGAEVVRRVPGDWTTLRDPVGREYCVTGRSPGA